MLHHKKMVKNKICKKAVENQPPSVLGTCIKQFFLK